MAVRLYWNRICPWSQRVRIVALEKNVILEMKEVPLSQSGPPDWFKELNKRGTVPTLQVGDRFVYESLIINRYLDETYPIPCSLSPGDPDTRYSIRRFCDEADRCAADLYDFFISMKPEDFGETSQKRANDAVAAVEKLLIETSSGPFFLGLHFSLADIALIPFLVRMEPALRAFCGADLFQAAPRLNALLAAASLRPSVYHTIEPPSYYIDVYREFFPQRKVIVHPLKLYVNQRCPFSLRARLVAALLNIPLELIEVPLPNPCPEYRKKNARGTTPTLEVRPGKCICDSTMIMEYLCESEMTAEERRNPDFAPPLVPRHTLDRAAGRFFMDDVEQFVDAFIAFKKRKAPDTEAEFTNAARNLERLLKIQHSQRAKEIPSGPFFMGKDVSLPDLSLIPIMGYALHQLVNVMNVEAELPALLTLQSAAMQNPMIKAVMETRGISCASSCPTQAAECHQTCSDHTPSSECPQTESSVRPRFPRQLSKPSQPQ